MDVKNGLAKAISHGRSSARGLGGARIARRPTWRPNPLITGRALRDVASRHLAHMPAHDSPPAIRAPRPHPRISICPLDELSSHFDLQASAERRYSHVRSDPPNTELLWIMLAKSH